MFTPSALKNQLMKYLPRLTNLFCENVAVTGIISGSAPQTLTITLPAHGYSTGQYVVLSNSLINNKIIGVSQYINAFGNKILRCQTAVEHDLICNQNLYPPDIDEITMVGFTDTGLNTTFILVDVPDRTHFDILYPTIPTLNGNEMLQVNISTGLDDIWPITKIDNNNFSISLVGAMYFQPGTVAQLNVSWKFRIASVYDWSQVESLYTKEDGTPNPPTNGWIYVIMDECTGSKDINIQSDAKQTNTLGNEQRIKMINKFFLNVVLPTDQSFTGSEAIELSWSEILFDLVQVMSGVNFPTTLNSPYVTSLIGHGPVAYNTAYYGHSYSFEYVYEIANVDTFNYNFNESVALRNINFSLLAPLDTGSTINLDEDS